MSIPAFRPGNPYTFIATRTFDLGTSGLKLTRGDQVQFDGTQVHMAGHPPVAMPQMRGAIRAGWLVLDSDFDQFDTSALRPVSAGVQVRAADGGNPMNPQSRTTIATSVDAEERTVTNVQQHAQATSERNQTYRRGSENRAVLAGTVQVEAQEGVPVRSLKTPAKQSTNLEKTSVYEAERQANSVKIEPGQGMTREEMMARMTPEERAQYEQKIGSHRAVYAPEPMVVGKVASPGAQQREGMLVQGSVGGGTEIADMGGTGHAGAAQVTESVVEGVKMTNTNGPGTIKAAAAPLPTGVDGQARAIARAICPDFPDNYQFGDPLRKKIARLQADYDDRPDVIRAVAAADTDPEVRGRLLQEFPEAFGG